ncbi:internal scaffolding protein [Blackfly microvirus SF02]|uniref:Internal scaffolding protein n=1 Tax=Blackfly microvirus SF02 TaxID=2576452 RepID=A0A4P8PLK5_9VIRU|nr:internal scaffolding protein [Blackfly microvirus SF02]
MFTVPFVRNPYNYDAVEVSDATGLRCEDISRAVQDQRDEVDINTIVRRFGLTGQLPDAVRAPEFGDFTGAMDYQSSLNAIRAAQDSFMEMPAELRTRLDNDPQQFLEFVADPKNVDELKKYNLVRSDGPVPVISPLPSPVNPTP